MLNHIEQEKHREAFAQMLGRFGYTIKRCEHPTCEQTALWVYKGNQHVATVSHKETTSKYKWRANKLHKGQPITDLPFENLEQAYSYILTCC